MSDPLTQPVRGFRDQLPPESERTAALEHLARQVFALYGIGEVRLPTLESRELFIKTTGETTDIVEKEMFAFSDAGGRHLAMRPEGTPGTVRAFLDKHLNQQGGACKLFYVGSMFRAERPQKGRYREFGQIGIELFGNPHPAADVEAILALKDLFDRAGLAGRLTLRLNNLGCDESPECRPRFRERLREYLKSREAELCESCRRRLDRNPLRCLDCKGDAEKLTGGAPRLEPCVPCRDHVAQVSAFLGDHGLPHTYPDPALVRGLDYYTRTVFEFQAEGIGSQNAIAGGGRYDSLIASMGGPATPAVGWALGVERTLLAVAAADPEARLLRALAPERKPAVFVALQSQDPRAEAEGMRLMASLRAAGLRTAGGLFAASLKSQMKEAGRQGAPVCIILGDEEIKKEPPSCIVKDMLRSQQSEVPLTQVPEAVRRRLETAP